MVVASIKHFSTIFHFTSVVVISFRKSFQANQLLPLVTPWVHYVFFNLIFFFYVSPLQKALPFLCSHLRTLHEGITFTVCRCHTKAEPSPHYSYFEILSVKPAGWFKPTTSSPYYCTFYCLSTFIKPFSHIRQYLKPTFAQDLSILSYYTLKALLMTQLFFMLYPKVTIIYYQLITSNARSNFTNNI